MTTHLTGAVEPETIPPIVLLVEDDHDTLEMYSAFFEMSGMWVATSTAPLEAMDAVDELKPDVIVTDVGFAGRPLGMDLVQSLKSRPDTQHIPVIALSGGGVDEMCPENQLHADICLEKPVLPDLLLETVRRLLHRSQLLRQRGEKVREAAHRVSVNAADLLARVQSSTTPEAGEPIRGCPECASRLEWIERGRIGGAEYDYYRWCFKGCGLFCYDRDGRKWVKLA